MEDVLKAIEDWGFRLNQMDVLETFGGYGEFHVDKYGSLVKSMQIWEIHPEKVEVLENKYPHAEIKNVDSYEEIKVTQGKFDMVLIDPVKEQHCFDMFPQVFRVLRDNSVLVLSVETPFDLEAYRRIVKSSGFQMKETFIKKQERPDSYSYLTCWLVKE